MSLPGWYVRTSRVFFYDTSGEWRGITENCPGFVLGKQSTTVIVQKQPILSYFLLLGIYDAPLPKRFSIPVIVSNDYLRARYDRFGGLFSAVFF